MPAVSRDLVVDFGAGVGTAGFAVAARVAGIDLALIEMDQALADLAARNARRNDVAGVTKVVVLDVTGSEQEFAKAGMTAGCANCVLMNPPFHEAGKTNPSRDAARRTAYIGGGVVLARWIERAKKLLCDGGSLTLIYRADSLATVLDTLAPGFGTVTVIPVHPKPAAAAIKVIVGAKKAALIHSLFCRD